MALDPMPTQPATSPDAQRLQLADALCARLCHDLSGPLGTLIGTLEMAVEEAASAAGEALPLASEAATLMGRRLRLLRAAWAGDCGQLTTSVLAELAEGLPPRIRAEFSELPHGPFTADVSRLLINLLLLGADALPRGGTVRFAGAGDIVVRLEGASAMWPEALISALADPQTLTFESPRTVQAPLCVLMAQSAGLRLSLLLAPGLPTAAAPPLVLGPL